MFALNTMLIVAHFVFVVLTVLQSKQNKPLIVPVNCLIISQVSGGTVRSCVTKET